MIQYGDWTVISEKFRQNKRTYLKCRCACGNVRDVLLQNLKESISTGCRDCHLKRIKKKKKPVLE